MPALALQFLLKPIVIVSLLLAISLGTNAIQRKVHQHDQVVIARRTAEREEAIAAGAACSTATARLRSEADARVKEVAAAAALAHSRAVAAERRATTTLQEKPMITTPAGAPDLCASALDLSRRKIEERTKP